MLYEQECCDEHSVCICVMIPMYIYARVYSKLVLDQWHCSTRRLRRVAIQFVIRVA